MHLVGCVARDRPRRARTELLCLAADAERQGAGQHHAELLVLVLVLGHDAIGVELDDAEREPVAVDDPSVDTVPDALGVE